MSGVAKDETNPSSPSEETVSAVGDAEAGHVETSDASDSEARARRSAPHLRVVTDSDDVPFAQEPVVPLIDQPNMRIGAVIKATRESLGYTLDQVSKEIRVHLSHLRAIEDMTPNLLGAPVYAKGYIKAYARHLGLDEQTTLERYLRECAILKDPVKHTIAPPSTGRKLPAAVPVFGFLIVALVAGAGYFFFANGDSATDTPQVANASAPPAPSVGQSSIGVIAAPSTSAASPQLRVVALKREQLEVRSADGTKFVHRDFAPGETYIPRVGSGWTVSTPDGSAFEWRLGDSSLGPLAEAGAVNAQSVDIAAQRPPIIVEAPVDPSATAETSPTPGAPDTATTATPQRPLTSGSTTDFRSPSGATTTRPPAASTNPAPQRPRPRPATPPVASAPPAANPPVTQPGAVATPVQDPALAAYPDQLPSQ
jgi:cytoskeleton protein RodZ